MKRHIIFLLSTSLLLSSCKKEVEALPDSTESMVSTDDIGPYIPPVYCAGNFWDDAGRFYPDWYLESNYYLSHADPLVYNNKVYVPDYDNQEVRIYDGSSWQTLPSAVPFRNSDMGISFTAGTKGYIGYTGGTKQFWQYNFEANTWARKADYPGPALYRTAMFSIGAKGYVVCGFDMMTGRTNKVWEYNPSTNTWAQKANCPASLNMMSYFSIGNKGYIVCGMDDDGFYDKFLQFDPAANRWTYLPKFPGALRQSAAAFVISGKAYVGDGYGDNVSFNDYFRFDPATNQWSPSIGVNKVADLETTISFKPAYSFAINSRGYVAGRFANVPQYMFMYKYSPLVCTEP
jgi:hypothetical protein